MFGSHKSCRATIGALTEELARSAEANANLTARFDQANADLAARLDQANVSLQEARGRAKRQDKQLADAQASNRLLTDEVARMRAALAQIAANVDGSNQRILQIVADIAPALVEASQLSWLETKIIGANVASKLPALHGHLTAGGSDRNFPEVRMSSSAAEAVDVSVRHRGTFETACVAIVRVVGAAAPTEDVKVLLMKPEISTLVLLLEEGRRYRRR